MIDLDLSDEARAFIELARDAQNPGDEDRARVRAVLASRIGVAAGLGVVAGLSAAAQTATTAGAGAGAATTVGAVGASAVALKVIGAAVIVSAAVVGTTAVHRARHAPVARVAVAERARAPSPHPKAMVVASGAPAAAPEPLAPAGAPAAAPEPLAPASAPVPSGARVAPSDARAADPTAAKRPPRTPTIVPAAPAVADEAGLVHAGVVARRSGRPARALELFDLHARTYPQGVLAEERDVERALALDDLGRVAEARAAIDQFLQAHPASPLAARLLERARSLGPAEGHGGARSSAPSPTR